MSDKEYERHYWDSQAKVDPAFAAWADTGWDDSITRCLEKIPSDMSPGATVMEIGCGGGRLLHALATRSPEVHFIGVDVSEVMLAAASEGSPSNVDLLLIDGRNLPPAPELGLAYSVLVFQHIPDDAARDYIYQVADRLIVGGCFVCQYVVGSEDLPMNHHRSTDTMEKWCSDAGLHVMSHDIGHIYHHWGWIKAVKV